MGGAGLHVLQFPFPLSSSCYFKKQSFAVKPVIENDCAKPHQSYACPRVIKKKNNINKSKRHLGVSELLGMPGAIACGLLVSPGRT